MDPDCAICSAPAITQCICEAKALDRAVSEAEQRMMDTFFSDIRLWVRNHAQDFILNYFSVLSSRRQTQHASHIDALTRHAAYYRQRPHPAELSRADAELKRGIDDDWRASVQRYPEVLEYFYSLVDWKLPSDDDAAVRDPPLSALGGARKPGHRVRIMVGDESTPLGRLEERNERREIRRPMPPMPPGYSYPAF